MNNKYLNFFKNYNKLRNTKYTKRSLFGLIFKVFFEVNLIKILQFFRLNNLSIVSWYAVINLQKFGLHFPYGPMNTLIQFGSLNFHENQSPHWLTNSFFLQTLTIVFLQNRVLNHNNILFHTNFIDKITAVFITSSNNDSIFWLSNFQIRS